MTLPTSLAVGDLIDYANRVLKENDCLSRRFTFAGGEFFERMKERGLYSVDEKAISKKVEAAGLLNVYNN